MRQVIRRFLNHLDAEKNETRLRTSKTGWNRSETDRPGGVQ